MAELAPEPLAARAAAIDGEDFFFNASAVSFQGRGVLLLGASGRGKSTTALGLVAFGAELIGDDGVWLRGGVLMPPKTAPALIEVRGLGLLHSGPICAAAPLALVVDLDQAEEARLPPRRIATTPDEKVTLIRAASDPTLVYALLQFLRYGRAEP